MMIVFLSKILHHFSQMAITDSDAPLEFSSFHALLHNGIDRLFELIQHEDFTFVVKDQRFKSTLAEAIIISPIISERLKSDPTNREFCFLTDELEPKQFSIFPDFIPCRDSIKFSGKLESDSLSIWKMLGNESFSLTFLHLIHSNQSDQTLESKKSEDLWSRAMLIMTIVLHNSVHIQGMNFAVSRKNHFTNFFHQNHFELRGRFSFANID
jgi:hypothetical protein